MYLSLNKKQIIKIAKEDKPRAMALINEKEHEFKDEIEEFREEIRRL